MKKFYITTAIPYVNARPHIGHALEFVQADTIARFHRQKGEEVLLLSGSDENALKNVQAAEQAGVPVRQFIDENAVFFQKLAEALGVQLDVFQKGSKKDHYASSQKLWELCQRAGDIYKKAYEGLYCLGCETFYAQEDLNEKGECIEHLGRALERVSEENYFFKLSKYQSRLRELIESDELRVVPQARKNEVLSFLKRPLQDISISRSNERAKNWGVPVPGDDSQRMYVWFDALNIYQSGIGFGLDLPAQAGENTYKKWWPADVHVIGKGIIRFHAVYWPAFLLSAGLPLPRSIFVHGYITVDGQKMSKTLGNVVDPFSLVEKYRTDAVRYFLLREIPPFEDGDFSYEKFEARYNADLAAGVGNLVSRVLALAEKSNPPAGGQNTKLQAILNETKRKVDKNLEEFRFSDALIAIWEIVHFCDKYIDEKKPWAESPERVEVVGDLLGAIAVIGELLQPLLPETSEKIAQQLRAEADGVHPLFPRLDR